MYSYHFEMLHPEPDMDEGLGNGTDNSRGAVSSQHETVDAADFHRIMSLGQQRGETAEVVRKTAQEHVALSNTPGTKSETTAGTGVGVKSEKTAATGVRLKSETTAAKGARIKSETTAAQPVPVLKGNSARIETAAPLASNSAAQETAEPGIELDTSDTLERQFVLFRQEEARSLLKAEKYSEAEPLIFNFLNDMDLQGAPADEWWYWFFEMIEAMQMQEKWQESFDSLEALTGPKPPAALAHWKSHKNRMSMMAAEALFQLGQYARAKDNCQGALKRLDAESKSDPGAQTSFYCCLELMARITEAMGGDIEARFYKSKVVPGYISKPALAKYAREKADVERELSKGTDVSASQNSEERRKSPTQSSPAYEGPEDEKSKDDLLRPFGFTYAELKEETFDWQVLNAFEHALKHGDEALLSITLLDRFLVSRHDYTFVHGYRCALYHAIEYDRLAVAKLLINRGADVNSWSSSYDPARGHFTPLGLAAKKCETAEMALLLLDSGADPNVVLNRDQHIPLSIATEKNNLPLVKLLLSRGALPNVNDPWNIYRTPALLLAVQNRFADVAEVLIDAGANCSIAPLEVVSPLHVAASNMMIRTVKLLCEKGSGLNQRDGSGRTPMDRAYRDGKGSRAGVEIMRVLYRYGGRLNKEPSLIAGRSKKSVYNSIQKPFAGS